jgi:hypothetical protein
LGEFLEPPRQVLQRVSEIAADILMYQDDVILTGRSQTRDGGEGITFLEGVSNIWPRETCPFE